MELYHVLNRGVEKRTLFLDSQDYARFVHNMYEFNDANPAENSGRNFKPTPSKMKGFVNPSFERKLLVDIHGWCLMRNHYHLLLSEKREGGLSLFMRKLNVGYANYFNERYSRAGTLFQGRTKKKHIDSDAYFLHILNYIHLNPLDYLEGAESWRKLKIADEEFALDYLEKYRWSSFLDYIGKSNFPSILTMDLFGDVCDRKRTSSYLKSLRSRSIDEYTLE